MGYCGDAPSEKVIIFDWDDTICPSSFFDRQTMENIGKLPESVRTIEAQNFVMKFSMLVRTLVMGFLLPLHFFVIPYARKYLSNSSYFPLDLLFSGSQIVRRDK